MHLFRKQKPGETQDDFFIICAFVHVQLLQSCLIICDPVDCQAPLSMGILQQEYWSGLPCPPPGDLPDPGIKPVSPALTGGFFTTEPLQKPHRGKKMLAGEIK